MCIHPSTTPYWRAQLPDIELPWGAFGENLTSEGLSEDGGAHR